MITYGFGAIFSYVYIAGGGVRYTSLIFTRVLAHGVVERADRSGAILDSVFEGRSSWLFFCPFV